MSQVTALSVWDVLRIRNFRLLWLGQVISDFGDSLTMVALLILVNRLTGSTAAMAAMAIVLAVPQVTLGLIAGVYVDRLDRKRIMIVSDLLRGIMVLGFTLVASPERLWLLYVIGFIQASIGTFFTPARSALIPTLVPREGLMAANSLAQTSRVIMGVIGVSAGALLIGTLDVFWPLFVADALTFFISMLLIAGIVAPAHPTAAPGSVRAIFSELLSGVKVIFTTRVLFGTLVGAGITMLGMGAVNVLLIPFTLNDLLVSETWLGALEFAQTLSMILAGSLMAALASRIKPTHVLSLGMILLGLLTGLFAVSGNVWHILFILFGMGWLVTPIHASISTLMQTNTPDELRGRAGAALSMMAATTNLLSMAFAGLFGELVGIRTVFVLSGVIVVLAGLASAWVFAGGAQASPTLQPKSEAG
jgi:MFS family permease